MRTVNGSCEPEMSFTHSCGEVIKYFISDVMNTDSKKLSCKKCKKEIALNFPNYMMVQIENGKPIMRIDLGLVLTESSLNDPTESLGLSDDNIKRKMFRKTTRRIQAKMVE